jgi:hypothetical protein
MPTPLKSTNHLDGANVCELNRSCRLRLSLHRADVLTEGGRAHVYPHAMIRRSTVLEQPVLSERTGSLND